MSHIFKLSTLGLLACLFCWNAQVASAQADPKTTADVPQWSVYELAFTTSATYANPYKEVELSATFTGPGNVKRTVQGFWDGGATFKVRFTPTARGRWGYTTASTDAGLNGKRGGFDCTAPARGAHGFLRRDPAYPYSFIRDDGARFFMFGTTYYGVMNNALTGDKWKEAIDNSRAYGMNKVRMNAYPNYRPQRDSANRNARESGDDGYEQPTLKHWQRLDEVVRYMAGKDMLADLIVFSREGANTGTPEQHDNYLRYVIARYAAFPNVLWCLINEWNYANKPIAYWHRLGVLTQHADPYHQDGESIRATSIHQQTRQDFQFFGQSLLSHAIVQLGVRNQGKTFREGSEWEASTAAREKRVFRHGDEWGNYSIVFNWGRKLPVVNDEYGYIGEWNDQSEPKNADGKHPALSREKHRNIMWSIYAAGGYGSTGDKTLYPEIERPYRTAHWRDTAEYGDVKRLVDFFTTKGIEYWKLGTQNKIVKAGTRVYASSEPGKQYVVYAATGGAFALDLPAGTYTARRFDPRTGEDVLLAEVKGGGAQTFTLPDRQDWVVYLKAKSVAARK